jgi:hypothetical protein
MMEKPQLPPFHILVPVWGQQYVDVFLALSLPSLLAEGNLPALSWDAAHIVRIYSTAEDAEAIRSSAIYHRLAKLVAVDIRLVSLGSATPHQVMSDCYRDGIERADALDAPVIFLTADIILATGTFDLLQQQLAAGRRAVMTVGPRLRLDPAAAIFEKSFRQDDGTIAVPKRELAELAMAYLHPLCERHLVDGDSEFFVPANFIWQVGQAGLLFHCLHLHPLMVYPREKIGQFFSTIDDEYVALACPDPRDTHVVVDSDELAIAELTGTERVLGGPRRDRPNEALAWAWVQSTPQHRDFLKIPIRYHATELLPHAWQPLEAEARILVAHYLSSCERSMLHWLWHNPRAVILKIERWARGSALSPSGQIQLPFQRTSLVKRICVAGIDLMRTVTQLKSACRTIVGEFPGRGK